MINLEKEKIYWLAWSKIKGIGAVTLKKIFDYFGDLETAWTVNEKELLKIEGIGHRFVDNIKEEKNKINPEQLYIKHQEKNPHFLIPPQPEYPQLLLEIPSPPPVLYYKGKIEISEHQGLTPLIAIVGTRKPTEHGKRWTYNISKALAQKGFTVVSGLAEGIDSVAHRGCLDGGGRTIAVLGHGLDRVYPSNNKQLMAEIAEKGLILTEYDYGNLPERGNFPARNRIVAGLCRAVLVMEAPEKSGALITARYGTEFNRDVYTLPNTPDNIQARGCLRLIHKGAEVIITEQELLSSLGAIPDFNPSPQLSLFSQTSSSPLPEIAKPTLSPPLSLVYDAIATAPTPFDVIVNQSNLTPAQVSGILLQLELEGLVTQLPGMMYQK